MFILYHSFLLINLCLVMTNGLLGGHPKNLAWNGGPMHLNCENSVDLWSRSGKYLKENVIAVKAIAHTDDIYVITPRMKHGVLATVWLLIREPQGVELQPFPELRSHEAYDCSAVQNAVDAHLDHLGNLWVLDTGIINTAESPICTCPPKVVSISLVLGKLTKRIQLAALTEPTSVLQSLVVEYGGMPGKVFVYVSDASRGAILVHDTSSGSEWSVLACSPSVGLQMAMVKRPIAHNVLILVRLHHQGVLELDTASLRRKNTHAPLRVYGEHGKQLVLLGSDLHHVYIRHSGCADVISWDIRDDFQDSCNIHSAGPSLTPTSVSSVPLKHVLLVLDSNFGDTIMDNQVTYHRITFIDKL